MNELLIGTTMGWEDPSCVGALPQNYSISIFRDNGVADHEHSGITALLSIMCVPKTFEVIQT
jgi:hypothetical protein